MTLPVYQKVSIRHFREFITMYYQQTIKSSQYYKEHMVSENWKMRYRSKCVLMYIPVHIPAGNRFRKHSGAQHDTIDCQHILVGRRRCQTHNSTTQPRVWKRLVNVMLCQCPDVGTNVKNDPQYESNRSERTVEQMIWYRITPSDYYVTVRQWLVLINLARISCDGGD